jgi:hypothetical protein
VQVAANVAAADTGAVNPALIIYSAAASGGNPLHQFALVHSTTTNTSLKTIGTVPFTAGAAVGVIAYVVGHRYTTGESMVFYELKAGFKASTLNGSTPVQVGSTTTTAISTDASVTVAPTLSVVSSAIAVQVKLNATEDWAWQVTFQIIGPVDT